MRPYGRLLMWGTGPRNELYLTHYPFSNLGICVALAMFTQHLVKVWNGLPEDPT